MSIKVGDMVEVRGMYIFGEVKEVSEKGLVRLKHTLNSQTSSPFAWWPFEFLIPFKEKAPVFRIGDTVQVKRIRGLMDETPTLRGFNFNKNYRYNGEYDGAHWVVDECGNHFGVPEYALELIPPKTEEPRTGPYRVEKIESITYLTLNGRYGPVQIAVTGDEARSIRTGDEYEVTIQRKTP